MKWLVKITAISMLITSAWAVGEAGAIFLMIAPGAGPAATGEAQVAKVGDAYASYYNPAGLGFLSGREAALMHVNWLPNLADDLFYEFMAYRHEVPGLGTFGGHIIFLNLGKQIQTDENGNQIGVFRSNMWAITGSFGTMLNARSSIGVSAKIFHQKLFDKGVSGEAGKGISTDFAFDLGYLWKSDRINFGISIANIGPSIAFIDENQADPAPTNMRMGVKFDVFKNEFNRLELFFDMNKMLVASYSEIDWDDNGVIGGYTDNGNESWGGDYNSDGQQETAYKDKWYKALFTSWLDDWYLGGDLNLGGWTTQQEADNVIGGYTWIDNPLNTDDIGEIYGKGDSQVSNYVSRPECPQCEIVAEENGKLNEWGVKEIGTGDDRKFSAEFKEMVYNFGAEYWYTDNFVLRGGFIYDEVGKIKVPTFGAGIHLGQYGFDFGYTAGKSGHPRANTMYFSLNIEI